MDRRLHRRYPFCHPFSALPCAENQDTYENVPELQEKTPTVISMDVSYGGIRLVCEGSIGANGHIVHLKNKDGDEDGRVIRGRITSCHELENGCYATGIQFAPSRINMTNVID